MFGIAYPAWLNAVLIVAAAGLAYTQANMGNLHLSATAVFLIGLAQVMVTTLAALQQTVTKGVRRLQGRK